MKRHVVPRTMQLSSPAFTDGASIPPDHTCDGIDVSPALEWSGVPKGTRSLALIVEDPDAVSKPAWVHWLVTDIPPEVHRLESGRVPDRARIGLNDWKHPRWDGPAPPSGRHRYVFHLYALDCELGIDRPVKPEVDRKMKGHVLAEATLTGTYQKRR